MLFQSPVYIIDYVRSSWGRVQGVLAQRYYEDSLQNLGAYTLKTLPKRNDVHDKQLWLGCALTAGAGQNLARSIALKAEMPNDINASVIQKVCGSGIMSVVQGAYACHFHHDSVVCGGIEHVSSTPFLMHPSKLDHHTITKEDLKSHMLADGLIDAERHQSMAHFAEKITQEKSITREDLDRYAFDSLMRFQKYEDIHRWNTDLHSYEHSKLPNNALSDEVAIGIKKKTPETLLHTLSQLKPLEINGRITAAHASKLADGCGFLRLSQKKHPFRLWRHDCNHHQYERDMFIKIVGYCHTNIERENFLLAPIKAAASLKKELQWSWQLIDHIEFGEAFATLPVVAINEHSLSKDQVNPYGGACIVGHPLSATAIRLIGLACTHMHINRTKRAFVGVCIGGGEGITLALEQEM